MYDLKSIRTEIDSLLISFLPKSSSIHHQKVIDAMTYSFTIGGKRLRPILMLSSYQMFNKEPLIGKADVITPFMAAIEMIHTYSLIHDDLPAMDNDDLRRGKPTCHIKFNEANAILAGDALLNYAFELVINHSLKIMENDHDLGYRCMKAMKVLSTASGIYGMIGGQGADMLFESAELNKKEDLDYIHQNKTGSLITASLTIGGILGGCSEEHINMLTKVGNNIGFAFQIQDDILDLTSSEEILGKPIGSDIKNNKKTYISFVGLEQSKKDVDQLLLTSIELIKLLENNSLLLEVIEFLDNREY